MIKRDELLGQIKTITKFDAIIIGGGAVGLGAGVDSATRGLKTIVLEKYDFAKGTSSRSTKLLHGGVRYLAQLHFHLVKDSLAEKVLLYKNAPHLTKDCEFIMPCYNYFDLLFYRTGLALYDTLAGFPKNQTSKFLSKQSIINKYPNIKKDKLIGGIAYHDGIFDDARLALSLSQTILDLNSYAINYCEVTSFLKENNKIIGVTVKDTILEQEFTLHSSCVINATGIFSDKLRKIDDPKAENIVQSAQGVHIVVDQNCLPSKDALLVPKTEDGRVLFTVPWHNKVLIGTTDTPVSDSKIEPIPMIEEVDFIMQNINKYLDKPIQKTDIISVYAGIRPLIKEDKKNTSQISREEKIVVSDSNLVSIIGGKWTSYRRMSEKLIDFVLDKEFIKAGQSKTANLKLHGYMPREKVALLDEHLQPYGENISVLQSLEGAKEKLHPNLPFTKAQVIYAVRYEQAQTLDDVLSRRLRVLFLNAKQAIEMSTVVAHIMATELNKSVAWEHEQIELFKIIANNYITK